MRSPQPKRRRMIAAALAAVIGAALVWATLWVNLMAGLGPRVLGIGHGMTPGLAVTPATLARDLGLAAALLAGPLWLLAVVSGPWPLRALSLGLLGLGWYGLAEEIASNFAIDFGNTWAPGEAFSELFWVDRLTPALWGGTVLAYALVLRRLNARPPVTPPAPPDATHPPANSRLS